ncbi:MAG: SEC-C metal-binding domain-containing protein, partial [Candidatus Eremiobacteraeota bacterium]|nr:SEC-C metal-binding domain-containing protein [Candidatus Eremiobacteraeota bacterium]
PEQMQAFQNPVQIPDGSMLPQPAAPLEELLGPMPSKARGPVHTKRDGEEAPKPTLRDQPKVGRNDLCPCGSGKKFKKCHGAAA